MLNLSTTQYITRDYSPVVVTTTESRGHGAAPCWLQMVTNDERPSTINEYCIRKESFWAKIYFGT